MMPGSVPSFNFNTTDTAGTFRGQWTAKRRISNLRPCFAGFDAFGGDFANAYTIVSCYLETGGVAIPVRFVGAAADGSKQVNPGDWVEGLPVGVTIASGGSWFWRVHVTVASAGQNFPLGKLIVSANGEATNRGVGSANLANGTGTTSLTITTGSMFGPVCTLGDADSATLPIILATGDSNTNRGDGGSTITWATELARLLNLPIINIARYGEQLQNVTTSPGVYVLRRQALIPDATHAGCLYGTNDRRSGARTAAQTQTDLLAYFNTLARQGLKVIACTQPPETTSSDAWATTANQTVTATEAVRTATNTYVRTKPAPVYAVWDIADLLETARNSGIWALVSAAAATGDGLHLGANAATSVATALVAAGALSTLTALDATPLPTN